MNDVPWRNCAAPGCGTAAQSNARWSRNPYCRSHAGRLRDTGDLVLAARPSAWDRFVDRVLVLASGCWLWTGGGTGRAKAYGNFWYAGKNEPVTPSVNIQRGHAARKGATK